MPTLDSNEELREALAYLVSDTDRDYASLLQEEKQSVDYIMELVKADREAATMEALKRLRKDQVGCAYYESKYGFSSKEAYKKWNEGWHGNDVTNWMMDYFGVWQHEESIDLNARIEAVLYVDSLLRSENIPLHPVQAESLKTYIRQLEASLNQPTKERE